MTAAATAPKASVTLRLDPARRDALDALAAGLGRDRSWVINEAIEAYLAVQAWQTEHIREGLRQAEAGEFASPDEVEAAFARLTGADGAGSARA